MREHTVTAFDQDLKAVDRLIHEMSDLAAAMVGSATRALLDLDNALAQNVVSQDKVMDAMQRDLDERAITLIALRQPVAGDLRSVVGAIRMAADLERIGDLAKNIAKRVGAVGEAAPPRRFAHGIDAMTDLVLGQVEGVVRKYEERDAEGLSGLRAEDEKIDIQYTGVFRELLTYMMEDPRNITASTPLLFIAKNIERIGDHATNIAETVHYLVTGESPAGERPKNDTTSTTAVDFVTHAAK
jgi:phosphate transport system protein